MGPWTFFRPDYLRNNALNGQSTGEVRRWRWNALTNYSVTRGRLKGMGLGAGYRWEDQAVIGYAPMRTAAGDDAINLNAPVYAPAQDSVDLWISYERDLSRSIRWKVQFNVYNALGKNELIPFAAGVDHEKLAGIGPLSPSTVIPMKPVAFTIREGLSWQISHTFEF